MKIKVTKKALDVQKENKKVKLGDWVRLNIPEAEREVVGIVLEDLKDAWKVYNITSYSIIGKNKPIVILNQAEIEKYSFKLLKDYVDLIISHGEKYGGKSENFVLAQAIKNTIK